MQQFTQTPTQPRIYSAQFTHADGTVDTGFTAPITWTIDQSGTNALASLSTSWTGSLANQVKITPLLPAAGAGGTVAVTGNFVNENGVTASTIFQVLITVNPNPATGLLMA